MQIKHNNAVVTSEKGEQFLPVFFVLGRLVSLKYAITDQRQCRLAPQILSTNFKTTADQKFFSQWRMISKRERQMLKLFTELQRVTCSL